MAFESVKQVTITRISREIADLRSKIESTDGPRVAGYKAELVEAELNLQWWALAIARGCVDVGAGTLIAEQQAVIARKITRLSAKTRQAWRKVYKS